MRRYRPSYFLSQAFKGLLRNGMMTLASVIVLLSCLIAVGCFSMLVINIDHNLESLGDLNEIVAFADTDEPYEAGKEAMLAPAITAEGKKFLGWSTNPEATSPEYKADEKYVVSADDAINGIITMYAIWEGGSDYDGYQIRYNTSGFKTDSDLPLDDKIYKNGNTINLPDKLDAKYSTIEFLGWSLKPNSDTADFLPNAEYNISSSDAKGGVITLYATWSEKQTFATFSVVYDTNRVDASGMMTDSEIRLEKIKNKLNSLDNIAENGITFVSKEETLESEKEKLKDYPSLLQTLEQGENPYPDSFLIEYENVDEISALQSKLENIDGIYKTRCRIDIAENIDNLKNGIILIFSWFMAILLVVSVFVIINTIKLAVVSRSKEITIMRYVGATKFFIALPFQLEGVIIGLVSGIAAFFIQWGAYGYIQKLIVNELKMIDILPFGEIRLIMFFGCIAIGIITGLIGSIISIRRYLKA